MSELRNGLLTALAFCVATSACGEQVITLEDPPSTNHGYVKLELKPAQNSNMPYVGTATMTITMHYLTCLAEFYRENPNWTQDGSDGVSEFDDWRSRLCSEGIQGRADCQVESIRQSLDDPFVLRVDYVVEHDDVEDGIVRFGPLPNQELADCGDAAPQVQLFPFEVAGSDAAGNQIWLGQSVNPDVAHTGQGLPMLLRALRE